MRKLSHQGRPHLATQLERSSLWRSTLGIEHATPETARLRESFLRFRTQVASLVVRIAAELPDLTVHDVSHLDALWETAGTVAGEDHGLNPLEAYVLGGAILLHDAAHCIEAYEGGLKSIRDTVLWRDSFELQQRRSPGHTLADQWLAADFSTIRALHADQAAVLATRSWHHPDTGDQMFLLEDHELRSGLGPLIGKLAASHHWDLDQLPERLPAQFNPLPSLPPDWIVDPVRLACLLRCADAAHLDERRAPHFLYALLERSTYSTFHWRGQNRLTQVSRDAMSASTDLVFHSTSPFTATEHESWWVLFDAIQVVHRELAGSHELLTRLGRQPLAARGVKGATHPSDLARFVQTDGWEPAVAEPHIKNVEGLIGTLGGEALYGTGDGLQVTIRELLQNSRDACVARSALDEHHEPWILLEVDGQEPEYELTIVDNGVGMSRRVMTGALLDFGQSFWSTDLVQAEFPGLLASGYEPVGKYGIGFYATFMAANAALIMSRRWTEGVSDSRSLEFNRGLEVRPVLRDPSEDPIRSDASTSIKLQIREGLFPADLDDFVIRRNILGIEDLTGVPLEEYIASICIGLDVPVWLRINHLEPALVHESQPLADRSAIATWLRRTSHGHDQPSALSEQDLSLEAERLRPLMDRGRCRGFAAINARANNYGIASATTVGGLNCDVHRKHDQRFIGWIDMAVDSARRDALTEGGDSVVAASRQTLESWLGEQRDLLLNEEDPERRLHASGNLLRFGCDPQDLLTLLIATTPDDVRFVGRDELVDLARSVGLGFYITGPRDNFWRPLRSTEVPLVDDAATVLPGGPTERRCTFELGADGRPIEALSLAGLLHDLAERHGNTAMWTREGTGILTDFGDDSVSLLRLRFAG